MPLRACSPAKTTVPEMPRRLAAEGLLRLGLHRARRSLGGVVGIGQIPFGIVSDAASAMAGGSVAGR